jgi:hypothetical protein
LITIEIFDHIWTDVEIKLYEQGIKTRYKRIFQDLIESYYGQTLAYDEGLSKDDIVLASALWRNFYHQSPDVTITNLTNLINYIRSQLLHIDQIPRSQFLTGNFDLLKFESFSCCDSNKSSVS